MSILASLHLPTGQRCASLVSLLSATVSTTERHLLDTNTGVRVPYDTYVSNRYLLSPNERFRYELDEGNVIITDFETDEQMLLYSGENISELVWSGDSQSLIIWQFQAATGITTVTSYYIASGEVRFEYRNPSGVRWRRQNFGNSSYLYAQIPLETSDTLSQAVIFMNTNTGSITEFQNPTRFPFVWSEGGRWVANEHWYGINIIDPETGDFHPSFTEPFIGYAAIWQGDTALWFERDNEANSSSIWRTNLADGNFVEVLPNATLELVSSDGQWVYGYNALDEDMALMHIASGERLNLGISRLQRGNTTLVFSPDGDCAAIATLANDNIRQLRIVDLETRRIYDYQDINGSFNGIDWANFSVLE